MNSTKNKSTSLTQKKLISFSKKKLSKIPLIKKMIIGKKNIAGKNGAEAIKERGVTNNRNANHSRD